MTDRHQDILYNVTGQSLVWDCPEGRPSSVTSVTVYLAGTGDDGTQESATTGSATIEANPDTTFDADSGHGQANARTMNLTATTGITVGRNYLITNAIGEKEWPEVIAVSSGATATARNPLANAYASGDSFESTRISIAISSSWVQDQSNLSPAGSSFPAYRVRWVYVVGGVTCVRDSYFDVVRYAGEHSVTPAYLDSLFPGYADRLPTYHREDEGRKMIDAAYRHLRMEMQANGVSDAAIRDEDALNYLTALRFRVLMHEDDPDPEVLNRHRFAFESAFDRLFQVSRKVGVSADSSGAAHRTAPQNLWSK